MIEINPIRLKGEWVDGYALDLHTERSDFIGFDAYDKEIYDTKRTPMGELLYKLKYRYDESAINDISNTAADFIKNYWQIDTIINGLIPVPPSKVRSSQPVMRIAGSISSLMNLPVLEDGLSKVRETPELKGVIGYNKRLRILREVFRADKTLLQGKNILLFDDLFRSGATFTAVTRVLYHAGNAGNVYVLALTRTRKKS